MERTDGAVCGVLFEGGATEFEANDLCKVICIARQVFVDRGAVRLRFTYAVASNKTAIHLAAVSIGRATVVGTHTLWATLLDNAPIKGLTGQAVGTGAVFIAVLRQGRLRHFDNFFGFWGG